MTDIIPLDMLEKICCINKESQCRFLSKKSSSYFCLKDDARLRHLIELEVKKITATIGVEKSLILSENCVGYTLAKEFSRR